jgi:hypothetical protein
MAEMNSSNGMEVFFSIKGHLFLTLSIARSEGTLVKRDITSNESSTSEELIFLPESVLNNSIQIITDRNF